MEIGSVGVCIWGIIVSVFLQFSGYTVSSSSILAHSVNECFERVSVGKRLNNSDVTRSVPAKTLKQCDVLCQRDMCNAYAFGIGPNGNGTCEISVQLPRSPPNEDPDFDLFIRVLQCRNMTMCFKRLVNGRRLIDRYIRRTFPCDSLSRCQLACSIERDFICEGFNYRFATDSDVGNSCQLTAMPGSHLDLTLDFSSDYDYDFYERDRNAPLACGQMSYKTWNFGYIPQTKIISGGINVIRPTTPHWQQAPNGVYIPSDIYVAKPQPRFSEGAMYKPKWNNNGYECFVRARTGFKLDRRIVILTLNTPTLYDCELVCANEKKFVCNILSYRYSSLPSTDNCQLGEKTMRQLDIYIDIIPDRDYDVYVRNEYSRPGCQPSRTWDSDCFERIRSGLSLEKSLVKFAVNTDSLIECELICLHIRHFTCRAFSFRYGPISVELNIYNCLLTDIPVPEMDPAKHFMQDGVCELYHRASYGHGCELDQWPFNMNSQVYSNFIPPQNSKQFWSTQPPYLHPPIFVSSTPNPLYPESFSYSSTFDLDSPEQSSIKPSTGYLPSSVTPPDILTSNIPQTMRPSYRPQKNPYLLIPSLAFKPYNPPSKTFIPSSFPGRLPALPTYTPKRDKIPQSQTFGSKPMHSKKNDKLCYITYGNPARLLTSAVRNSLLVVSEQECKAECSRARENSYFRCATLSYWSGHCELTDIELRDLRPGVDFNQDDTYWLFSWDFTDPRCYIQPTGPIPPPGNSLYPDTVWSTFTVSGQKCSRGTFCTHSTQAGIWSCPVDNGDWDYCCRPGHHCGYSEGYSYPWCYVGTFSKEQWRPCNNFYYPYQANVGRALHWPISYVHRNGPPNTTSGYQPSVVDNFLESLHFTNNDDPKYNISESNPTVSTSAAPPYSTNASSNVIEFQVIDVTESEKSIKPNRKEQILSADALWEWDSNARFINNITTDNRHFGVLQRYSQENEKSRVKGNIRKRSLPNPT